VAAVVYYRIARSGWSRSLTETGGPGNDRLVYRAPEALVAIGVGGPLAAGVIVAVLTGEWRWAETGFAVWALASAWLAASAYLRGD
jgi:hypothetical protein